MHSVSQKISPGSWLNFGPGISGCDREFMSHPAAKGNTGVPPVLASGHPDRGKSLVGGTPATRHSRDGHVPLHEKAVAPEYALWPDEMITKSQFAPYETFLYGRN